MKGLTFTSSAALHNNDSRSCVLVVVRVIVEVVGNGATQPGPPAESAQSFRSTMMELLCPKLPARCAAVSSQCRQQFSELLDLRQ